jgi:hypothetical protein
MNVSSPPSPRPSLRRVLLRASGSSLLLGLFVIGVASADDLPIVLSSQHIGMSGEQLQAMQAPAPAPVAMAAAKPSSEAPLKLTLPSPNEPLVASEFVSADPGVCPSTAGAALASFDQCVETSVRAGVGLRDSSRVCRALFPAES